MSYYRGISYPKVALGRLLFNSNSSWHHFADIVFKPREYRARGTSMWVADVSPISSLVLTFCFWVGILVRDENAKERFIQTVGKIGIVLCVLLLRSVVLT